MVKGQEGKCSREMNAVVANSDPVTSKRHGGGTSLAYVSACSIFTTQPKMTEYRVTGITNNS